MGFYAAVWIHLRYHNSVLLCNSFSWLAVSCWWPAVRCWWRTLQTKYVHGSYKMLVKVFGHQHHLSLYTIHIICHKAPTFKRCHRNRNSVTKVDKLSLILNHKYHDVTNFTVTLFEDLQLKIKILDYIFKFHFRI